MVFTFCAEESHDALGGGIGSVGCMDRDLNG